MLHAQLAKAYQRLAQLQIVERSDVFSNARVLLHQQSMTRVELALARAKNAILDTDLIKTSDDIKEVLDSVNYKQLLDIFETLVILRSKFTLFED